MKYFRTIFLLALSVVAALPAAAQHKGKPAPKARPVRNEMFSSMLPSTAKVMFVDSVVVGKSDFLQHLAMSADAGTISVRSNKYPTAMMPLTQYENGLGDRRIFSDGDTTATALYAETRLGSGWSQPERIAEISETTYRWQDFPFLMSDGVTLFFSAKGPQSMGGRDIFMTNFDADKGAYYEPQNYGLPFNSPANEYLLAIDDADTLGWLVSDRFQHKDSVCIYTFEPTATRLDFQEDGLSPKQLEAFARLSSIRSTWQFGDRKAALRRRDAMLARIHQKEQSQSPVLVINDGRLARSANDLRTAEGKRLYQQWIEVGSMIHDSQSRLETLRQQYAASHSEGLRQRIVRLESELAQQRDDLAALAKQIRKTENQ